MDKRIVGVGLLVVLGAAAYVLGGGSAGWDPRDILPANTAIKEGAEVIPKATTLAVFMAVNPSPPPAPMEAARMFPIIMVVVPAALTYDSSDIIEILPVYRCPGACQWLGDFTAGDRLEVHTVSSDGNYCYVEGTSIQAWAVSGWVSCARLAFLENAE